MKIEQWQKFNSLIDYLQFPSDLHLLNRPLLQVNLSSFLGGSVSALTHARFSPVNCNRIELRDWSGRPSCRAESELSCMSRSLILSFASSVQGHPKIEQVLSSRIATVPFPSKSLPFDLQSQLVVETDSVQPTHRLMSQVGLLASLPRPLSRMSHSPGRQYAWGIMRLLRLTNINCYI